MKSKIKSLEFSRCWTDLQIDILVGVYLHIKQLKLNFIDHEGRHSQVSNKQAVSNKHAGVHNHRNHLSSRMN